MNGFTTAVRNGNFKAVREIFEPILRLCAYDIIKQRKRIGGNWSVDFAVFSREQRDSLRKILGSNLIFIVLNMSKEYQEKRLINREGNSVIDFLTKIHHLYEPAENDEENTYNVTITEDMSPEDVVKKILENIY